MHSAFKPNLRIYLTNYLSAFAGRGIAELRESCDSHFKMPQTIDAVLKKTPSLSQRTSHFGGWNAIIRSPLHL